jgi:hypothetical protein
MATTQTSAPHEDLVLLAIKGAIKSETERLIKEAIESAQKEMERRTPEIIAGITIEVMKMTEYQIMQDRVIFTIRKI